MGIIAGSFTNAPSATETTRLGQIHIVATVLHQHRPTMTVEPWPFVDEIVRHTKPIPSLTPSKMSLMLKSGKDLVYDSQLNGELAVKGGSTNCSSTEA
jgi:hypothetical protein